MTDEEIKKHKAEYKSAVKVKERQKNFIKRKKQPKYECDPDHPESCIMCLDKTFNADDSIECYLTGETVFNPFDEIGKKCPKKEG